MALGQDRTLSEGITDVWAKLKNNKWQFFIAWFLVMMCGAVKKLSTFPMPYIAGQSSCLKEVTAIPQNDIANSAFMSGGRLNLNPAPSNLNPKPLHREPAILNPALLRSQPRTPSTQVPDTKTQTPKSQTQNPSPRTPTPKIRSYEPMTWIETKPDCEEKVNPQPSTLNPEPSPLTPEPSTLNPQP